MQEHQQHDIDRRRFRLIKNSNKTKYDEFYAKLERIRIAAASSKHCSHRTATELLDESKGYFVKSQEVLQRRQTLFINNETLINQKQSTPSYRIAQPHRSPYLSNEKDDQFQLDYLDLTFQSTSNSSFSDGGIFESVSLLSLSDQTTLDSINSTSNIKRTVIPSTSLSIIERNARIIKWLFQLNKANESSSFQQVL